MYNQAYAVTTFVDSKDVSTEGTFPQEVEFNSDGTKMFVADSDDNEINEYACTTGFDVSTCSDSGSPLDINAQETVVQGLTFNSDGTKMFISGAAGQDVSEYSCTDFDVSTCSYAGDLQVLDVSGEDTDPEDLAFNSDGTKLFVLGKAGNTVDKYNCTAFVVSICTSVDAFSLNALESSPHGLAFSTDGTKMFVAGTGTDSVYEYNCTAFDVSTCTFVNSFSVASQETDPKGITFSSDGLKMFVVGASSKDVHEYTLDFAFDLFTTISSSSNKSIADQLRTSEAPSFTKFLGPNEYPMSIQDTNYAYDDFSTKKTTIIKVGEPTQIKVLASDDGGGNYIKRISVYMNLHGTKHELFYSNTAVSYNYRGEPTIRNSEGIIDEFSVTTKPDGLKQLVTFDITFAKEMPPSDMIIQVVDFVNNSIQMRATQALEVIKNDVIKEEPVEIPTEIPAVDPKLKEQLQLPNWIKQTGKSWSDDVISDNGFSRSLGFMIHNDILQNENARKTIYNSETYDEIKFEIPSYLKNNASWLDDDLISDIEFINAIQFLLDNNHIKLKS